MFRISSTTALMTAAAMALPGAASAKVDASIHAEAHAVVDGAKAVALAKDSAARAEAAVERSRDSMHKAYVMTVGKGQQATASFSAEADAQAEKLGQVVRRSHGSLRAAAVKALADTGRWQATLVSGTAQRLQDGKTETTTQLGDDSAGLTATIVLTASSDGLAKSLRGKLDEAAARTLKALADLADAVRRGSDEQAKAAMDDDGEQVADAVDRSGRADVTFSVDGGTVTLGQLALRTVDTSESPVQAQASGEGHLVLGGGGRR